MLLKLSIFISGIMVFLSTIALYAVVGDLLFKTSPNHAITIFGLLLIKYFGDLICKTGINLYLEKSKGDKK
jgi:hypothetical protein